MKKRRVAITLLILIVLAAAVCNLPWPSRVNFSMDAVEVRASGTVIGEGGLEMKGWILNYLYKPDYIRFTDISILGSQASDQPGHLPDSPLLVYADRPDCYTIPASFYLLDEGKVVSVEILLSKETDWCCIRMKRNGGTSYVVAPGNKDIQTILSQYFQND